MKTIQDMIMIMLQNSSSTQNCDRQPTLLVSFHFYPKHPHPRKANFNDGNKKYEKQYAVFDLATVFQLEKGSKCMSYEEQIHPKKKLEVSHFVCWNTTTTEVQIKHNSLPIPLLLNKPPLVYDQTVMPNEGHYNLECIKVRIPSNYMKCPTRKYHPIF